jgi:hypothetical protein
MRPEAILAVGGAEPIYATTGVVHRPSSGSTTNQSGISWRGRTRTTALESPSGTRKGIYIVREGRRRGLLLGYRIASMDQSLIVDAIGKHMDLLEKVSIWVFILSLAIGWAGLQKQNINALGITFARREAFAAAGAVYLFANTLMIVLFLRVGDLLRLADEKTFPQAFTRLTTHTWIMNPYAYFGSVGVPRTYSCEGFGLLIVLWWFGNASLSTLIDGARQRRHAILISAFLVLGFAGMLSIVRVFTIILERGSTSLPNDLCASFSSTLRLRSLSGLLGVGAGVLLFRAVSRLRLHSPIRT